MNNVSYLQEVKKSNSNSDFHLQDVSFDIEKLQAACDEVLNMKGFDTSLGIPHFAGISLNQIPGDPDSIKGSKVRGVYWTKPDSTGKEVSRDVAIEEEKYTEFVKDFEHTYFKEVYDVLSKRYKLGRMRLLLKEPRSTLSWHRDPEPRLHIPIYTNPGAIMVVDKVAQHMPADGSVWITNNTKYHNAFNGGEENRVHLVACVLDYKFN
ncbi:aspartyl/asparaginyl beta-hydroxylase domain-containing protein [Candidatus Pelagibacter sp.]|nr:aspartyl/asparaginyl beta-hydroxylase domain-containing protein [Candidatus Pelagibacter sp.]